MTEFDEADAQIWGEKPPRDGIDQYARETDPFYQTLDQMAQKRETVGARGLSGPGLTLTVQERIDQLVAFVERMRQPDVVRPDEETSLRNLAQLVADAQLETAIDVATDVVMGAVAWPRAGAIRRRRTMDEIRSRLARCPNGCAYALAAHVDGRCPTEDEAVQKWGRS
jgi:hypothetical protein